MNNRVKIALLAGSLAFAPLIGLNLLLWIHINVHGRTDIQDAAGSMLKIAEQRLDEAMTQLISLGISGEHGCTPEALTELGRAILKAPHVSEIAVVDQAGAAVCSPAGETRVIRVVSPAHDTSSPSVKFYVADLGNDQGPRSVRMLWRFADGWGLSLLVPGDRLLPAVVVGRLQADFIGKLALVDGTFVSSRLSHAEMKLEGAPAFEVRAISDRYPLTIDVAVPSTALWQSYRELFLWGNAGGIVLAVISIIGALAVSRQMEGPVREIESAIRRREFIPYYQPVVSLRTGKLLGCEVLVRRRRADGRVDGPGSFIRLVEATGQIFEITRVLMAQARDELGPAYRLRPELKVSFNLVAEHFDDMSIVSDVEAIFKDSQVQPKQVVLEVTERQPLPNLAGARVIIAKLQELGVRISLDDVGTGHAGMSYLLKLGVDQMKMDKMFVDAIGADQYSSAIIDTLVKLAEDMGIEFVAEGVETFEQVEYLRERGVNAAQGFVFAPPLPGPLYLELINTLHPVAAKKAANPNRALRSGASEKAA